MGFGALQFPPTGNVDGRGGLGLAPNQPFDQSLACMAGGLKCPGLPDFRDRLPYRLTKAVLRD
jgi:hypothetical protein